MPDSQVEWSITGSLGIIRLNRPEKLNALTHAMMGDIVDLCRSVRSSQDLRAVVFLGNGRSFCAGQDLKDSVKEEPVTDRLSRELREDMQSAIAELPQPTIVGLHGHVLGRGLMLALACDIRVASSDAKLGFPEVKFGIIPGGGGTQRLTKVVGPSRALHMVLTGESIDSDLAMQWGLVTKVVATEDLETEAIEIAQGIVSHPGSAAIYSKLTIGVAANTVLSEGVKFEKTLSALLTGGEDWKRERERFEKER